MSNKKYTLTIKNDSRFYDGWGAIHTWAELKAKGEETVYLSFGVDSEIPNGMLKAESGVFDGELKCTNNACGSNVPPTDFYYAHRPASESYEISLTEEQYYFIKDRYNKYNQLDTKPIYALIPDPNIPDHRNCTMFVRDLLNETGIDTFQHVRTPEDIKYTIAALDRGEPAPDRDQLEAFAVANYDENLRNLINYANEHQDDLGSRVTALKEIYEHYAQAESINEKINILRGDRLYENINALKEHALTMNSEFDAKAIALAYASEQLDDLKDLAMDKVKDIHQQGVTKIVDGIEITVDTAKDAHEYGVNKLTDGIEITVDATKNIHQKGIALGVDAIETTVNLHGQAVDKLVDGIEATVDLHGQAVNKLTEGIETTVNTATDLHQKGVNALSSGIEATVDLFSSKTDSSKTSEDLRKEIDELTKLVNDQIHKMDRRLAEIKNSTEQEVPSSEQSSNERSTFSTGDSFFDELYASIDDPEKFDQVRRAFARSEEGQAMCAEIDQMAEEYKAEQLTKQQEKEVDEPVRAPSMKISF